MTVHSLTRPGRGNPPPPAKPVLRPLARLDVEQARCFLMELDDRTAGAGPMYLLGRLAEHAQALLDVVDAVTAVTP
jgi:hypothetical protein